MSLSLPGWLALFAVAGFLVAAAGVVLAREGDEIATRTGLGGLFVGMLLLAFATSLPEVVANVSAAVEGAPDLAVGDLFGSSMANMAIFAMLDLAHRGRLWPGVGIRHARLASIAIILTATAVLGIVLGDGPLVAWLGVTPVIVGVGYLLAAAWVRRSGRPIASGAATEESVLVATGWGEGDRRPPLRIPLLRFGAAALATLAIGPVLVLAAKGITDTSGLSQSFVGVALVAASTSLPELIASFAALRIGAYDLAVGNLFGSNAFNMATLFVADLAYTQGPILAAVDLRQVVAGVSAILMMALALAAIVQGDRVRARHLEPDAIVLLVVYLVCLAAVGIGP